MVVTIPPPCSSNCPRDHVTVEEAAGDNVAAIQAATPA